MDTKSYRVRGAFVDAFGNEAVSRLLVSRLPAVVPGPVLVDEFGVSSRGIPPPLDDTRVFCVPFSVSLTATSPARHTATFARISIICADPQVLIGGGTPQTYADYIAHDVANPAPGPGVQPTIQYITSAKIDERSAAPRCEFNLAQMRSDGGVLLPPTGPAGLQFYPYIVRIYAPFEFTAQITMQFK